ncbi:MAG: ABC transporter permease [Prevotella sp.]|nr:ABC transporter permease [Prevotella sp.]
MCYIWWSEMKNTFKDEGMLIFFIIVPLIYPLIYSWIYTNEVVREVPVAVIDMSHSKSSRTFIQHFDASPDVSVAYYCNNIAESQSLIGQQEAYGAIYIPADYEQRLGRGEQAHISIYCDMALMLTYKAIFITATNVSLELNSQLQAARSRNYTKRDAEITTAPIRIEAIRMFNATGGYGNALLPSVLLLILQQTLLLGIGLSAGTARETNPTGDLIPINSHYSGVFRIVLGKALCYLMLYAVTGTYIALCVPRLFGYTTLLYAPTDILGLMVPYLFACIFFGMFLSCLVRYRENTMLLVVFTSIPMLFLVGVSWPREAIPGYWQGVSWLIPSTFGIRGYLTLSSMGGTLQDIEPEYHALWLQTLVYFLLTCIVYRYQIFRARRHSTQL